jgi:hypothetical protein
MISSGRQRSACLGEISGILFNTPNVIDEYRFTKKSRTHRSHLASEVAPVEAESEFYSESCPFIRGGERTWLSRFSIKTMRDRRLIDARKNRGPRYQ